MRRVLIVEPKAADARALKKSLRDAGLFNASSLIKSTAHARSHLKGRDQNSILLLNIHARGGQGMEFLDWVRDQSFYKDLLVVAVGERSQLRTVVEACERGAHTFLIRPVHVEDLKNLAGRYPDHWGRAERQRRITA
jgi:DNA-binding NtrC family response regulator